MIYGPDGSIWQQGIQVSEADWNAIGYGMWRCIHQNGTPDATYRPMRDMFLARNIPFSAYAWVSGDPIRSADKACDAVGDKRIPIMADCEEPGYPFGNYFRWIERVRANGFKVRLMYTGRGYWLESGSPHLGGLGFDLVVSRYGDQDPNGKYEIVPRYDYMNSKYGDVTWNWVFGGLTPTFWQYGSRIRWGDRYMDMNAYRGLASTLGTWFYVKSNIPEPKPPLPPPTPFPYRPYNPIPPFIIR